MLLTYMVLQLFPVAIGIVRKSLVELGILDFGGVQMRPYWTMLLPSDWKDLAQEQLLVPGMLLKDILYAALRRNKSSEHESFRQPRCKA